MANYILVKEIPEVLEKDAFVIDKPNFMEQVEACSKKRPNSKLTTANYLREIAAAIGNKYYDEDFDAILKINISNYVGLDCSNNEKTHNIVYNMMVKNCPDAIDKYVEYYIKKRPYGTQLIYFLGNHIQTASFDKHGIQLKKLEKRSKKVVKTD